MSDPFADFMSDLVREYAQPKAPHRGKWEWWVDGRRRSHTICVTLGNTEITIVHRAVGTDGCMSELHSFTCDIEHLQKLAQSLNRAVAVATERGLIKQPKK